MLYLAKKHFDGKELIEKVLTLDTERRATQQNLDSELAEMNKLSKEIGELFKSGKAAEANAAKEKTSSLKEDTKKYLLHQHPHPKP